MAYRHIMPGRFLNKKHEFIPQYAFDETTKTYARRFAYHEIHTAWDCTACMGWHNMTLLEILKDEWATGKRGVNHNWRKVSRKEYEQKHLGPLILKEAQQDLKRAERMMST